MEIKSKYNIGDIIYHSEFGSIKKLQVTGIALRDSDITYADQEYPLMGKYYEKDLFATLKEAKEHARKHVKYQLKLMLNLIDKIKEEDLCLSKK